MAEKKKKPVSGDLAVNRRAWHDYSVLEKTECGIVLTGTEVKVLLRSAEWTLVEWEGQNGYLMNQYLAFAADAEEADVEEQEGSKQTAMIPAMVLAMDGGYAPVYDVDSEDATELGRLKNGKRLMVVETSGGWSLISYKDHTGYMRDDDLQFMLADEAAA
jgi:hypothetical protein